MNIDIFLLVVIVPIAIFSVSAFLKFPYGLEGTDRKNAIDQFKSDIGLDFYFIGLSVLIAIIIAVFGVKIPEEITIALILYALISAVIAGLYNRPLIDKKLNLSFTIGILSGIIPIIIASYTSIFVL